MMKQKTSPLRAVAFLALLAGACTMILPFVWMLSTSLKESNLVYTIPPQWIPNPVDWQNYRDVWSAANLLTGIKNSCVITFSVMAFSTLTSSMAAFAFAKLRFPGKNVIFMMLLATMMVPAVVLLVPDFIIYTKLKWIDTLLPMIVPASLCNVNNIFFMRQFMIGLPNGYLDAAKIDGCGYFRIFYSIIFPLLAPATATVVILKIVNIVNDMYVPYLYMPKTKLKTLTTFLMNYAGAQQGSWPTLAAAIIVVLIPTVVLYLIFHKQITEGLSAGATKE